MKKINSIIKKLALACLVMFAGTQMYAQERIELNPSSRGVQIKESTFNGFQSTFSFSAIESNNVKTEAGNFSKITINKTVLGGGVVIKNHANKAYITDALASAMVKTVFENADVKHQVFFNRSDVRSGSTLGAMAVCHCGMLGADIGLAQLAMHSACECFACKDYEAMLKLLQTFYSTELAFVKDNILIR